MSANLVTAKRHVLRSIKNYRDFTIFDEQIRILKSAFVKTVVYGESDSILLIGPPSCGKSSMVQLCVQDVLEEQGEDSFTFINLNGTVHTDDNIALLEIIKQLHSDQLDGNLVTGSFAGNLAFFLQSLNSGDKDKTKPIILVIKNCHLFCSHRNQMLLYNLFDICQSKQAPLCVVGLSSCSDTVDLFEKRVKSRFSHRVLLSWLDLGLEKWTGLLQSMLQLNKDPSLKSVSKSFREKWNSDLEAVTKSRRLVHFLRTISDLNLGFRHFKSFLVLSVLNLTEEKPFLTIEMFEAAFNKISKNLRVEIIKDLSVLELCLVIAMLHQNDIYGFEPMNFDMVFRRYIKFASTSSLSCLQRSVVYKAFERLKELELIEPVGGAGRKNTNKEYLMYNFIMSKEEINTALNSYDCLPTDIEKWAGTNGV